MEEMQKLDHIVSDQDQDSIDYHNWIEGQKFAVNLVVGVELCQMQEEVDNFAEVHYWRKLGRRVEDNFLVDRFRMHFVAEVAMEPVDSLVVGQGCHIVQFVVVDHQIESFVEMYQKEDSLVDLVEEVHIQQVVESILEEDSLVVDHSYLLLLEGHSLVVKMYYILVAEKYLVVHIDLVDLVYTQFLEVLDNQILDFDLHIEQDKLAALVVENIEDHLYIVGVQVQQWVLDKQKYD